MGKKFLISVLILIFYFFELITSQTEEKKDEKKKTYSEIINKDYVKIKIYNLLFKIFRRKIIIITLISNYC